jgi:hypothetical protein
LTPSAEQFLPSANTAAKISCWMGQLAVSAKAEANAEVAFRGIPHSQYCHLQMVE